MVRARLLPTLTALVALLSLASVSDAKDCGGTVACACGDRVIAPATLSQSLNNCLGDGLIVAAGGVDCLGRQIAGPGDQSSAVGIKIVGFNGNGASGVYVRNCRVRNFHRGIEVDSGTANTVENSVLFNNEIGIWLGDGTSFNTVVRNHVRDNRDEGIHVGSGTHHNDIGENSFSNNLNENLYLIGTSDNSVHDNELVESNEAAILLKNATGNVFTNNRVFDRLIHVRGNSFGNVFSENEVWSYFRFQANEEGDVWGYPHANEVVGGQIAKASTCVEFDGAHENLVSDVDVDTCRAYEEKERGGLVPFGNVVSVNRIDIGNARHSGQRRTASLRFAGNEVVPDRFKIDLRGLAPDTSLDPAHEDVQCSLTDFQGTVLNFFLPAGALQLRGKQFTHLDPQGTIGGLRRLDLREAADGRWRIKMTGKTAIETADYPLKTITCQVGDDVFEFNDFWDERARGWNLRVQP